MNETVKLGLTLLLITAVAAALLGAANSVTSERIAQADKIANDLAMQEVLDEAENFNKLDGSKLQDILDSNSNILEINEGYDADSSLVGYTFKAITTGYGGDIEFMVGISTDGYITGFTILNHGETPGLGENATKSYFTDSFKGKTVDAELTSAKDPKSDNEVQALTGATKTTNGVLDGVNTVRELFNLELAN